MLRLCKKCLVEKELILFTPAKNCKLGYSHKCLECKKKATDIYDNLPRVRQQKHERHKKYYASGYLATAKHNGNWEYYFKKGLTREDRRSLSVEDLLDLLQKQGGVCALSGVSLTCIVSPGTGPNNTNASIDRIIPGSKGGTYTIDNIRLVCKVVNSMRSTLSDEELLYWCTQIKNTKE